MTAMYQRFRDAFSELWRPTVSYGAGIAVIVGLFLPSVTAEKMLVLTGLVGFNAHLRSVDKRAKPDTPQ